MSFIIILRQCTATRKEETNSDLKMEVNGHDLAAEDAAQPLQPSLTLLRPRLKNTKVSEAVSC